jgi:hypothetical protein
MLSDFSMGATAAPGHEQTHESRRARVRIAPDSGHIAAPQRTAGLGHKQTSNAGTPEGGRGLDCESPRRDQYFVMTTCRRRT